MWIVMLNMIMWTRGVFMSRLKWLIMALMMLVLVTGCTSRELENEVDDLAKQLDESENEIEELEEENQLFKEELELLRNNELVYVDEIKQLESAIEAIEMTTDSTEESIGLDFERLLSSLEISDLTVSESGDYGTFSVAETISEDETGGLYGTYLYNKKERSVTKIDPYEGNVIWSTQESYIVVDSGTSVERGGSIYSIDTKAAVDHIEYVMFPLWVSDSELVYAKSNESVELDAAMELRYTTDIVVRDVLSGQEEVIFEGSKDYLMELVNIQNNVITAIKRYVGDDRDKGTEEITVVF